MSPPSLADGAVRTRRPIRPAAVLIGLLVLAGLVLLMAEVNVVDATRLLLVLAVQVGTGALLWRLVRGPVGSYVAEFVGMGIALGTLTSLLGAQLLRPTPLASVGWLLPSFGLAAVLALPGAWRRMRRSPTLAVSVEEVGTIVGGLVIGIPFLWSFWREHPLSWSGWSGYYIDIPFHEALATSLATWGPGDSILAVGQPIRYHWFAHAWAGATTNAASAPSFVVITRVLPLVALVGTTCLAWSWSRRLSERRSVHALAVLLTLLAMDVGTRIDASFLQSFTLSPSMALVAPWLLAAALVFTEHLAGRLRRPHWLLLLLAVGCVGGKTSAAAVLVGGVGLAALMSTWDRRVRTRAWTDLGIVLAGVAGAFVALILGSAGNLEVDFGATADYYSFLTPGWVGLGIGTVAVAFATVAKWAGVAVLAIARPTRLRPELWFALGAGLTGLAAAVSLGHPGTSQLYFPMSASIVVAVLSAWGLGEAMLRLSSHTLAATAVVGGAAGVVGRAMPPTPGLRPLCAGLLIALLFVICHKVFIDVRRQEQANRRLVVGSVLAWTLVAASVAAGSIVLGQRVMTGRPVPVAANTPSAWTQSHAIALDWLRERSAPDDLVMSNRQCSSVVPPGAVCNDTRWFLTAALAHRRMYIEGAQYAVEEPHPRWVDERIALSHRFVDVPGPDDAKRLWDSGVRWIVVDLASTSTRSWLPYAPQAFATDSSAVLRLIRP